MENVEMPIIKETMETIAKQELSKWADTLTTRDAHNVADRYADDATFFPTKNGELKRGKEGAEKYFTHFLESNPECTFLSGKIVKSADNTMVSSFGNYRFELDDKDNSRVEVEAEYTFVLFKDGDDYEIKHHHSSLVQNEAQMVDLNNEVIQCASEENLKQIFSKYFQDKTGEIIEEMVIQFSADNSFVTISVMHSHDVENRSTVILEKINDEEWKVQNHHFSPRPKSE